MGIASVITTGPNEEALSAQVIAGSKTGRAVPAHPSLKGLYELARRASVYVGGDTGPTHLAIAAETPVVGLFGPTEWWRNGSLNPDDICVERVDIGCRSDCHRRTCSQWICMDTNTDKVYTAVSRRLALALVEAAIQQ
jgi:ADP-heptose:LPS heptosyltransferase